MSRAKYRISRITAEGFRGFTAPQSIEIDGKSAFVFGVNGQGKSSLIEAVRWVLFGSPSGREIEVRNTFYAMAACAVTIELTSDNGPLKITRELPPGTTLSRQTIKDSAGNTVAARDVLPQLARIGHHEGTQVIFAAQHATGRQGQVDITDFTKVLCFYLRLEKVPELVQALESLIEERSEEFRLLSQKVENAQGEIRAEIDQTETRLAELLKNPPWGEGPIPTGTDTEAKIVALAGEAAKTKGTALPDGTTGSHEILSRLKGELDGLKAQATASFQKTLGAASTNLVRAEGALLTLAQSRDKRAALNAEIQARKVELSLAMGADTAATLPARLTELERSMTESGAKADIAERAKKLCIEYGWSACPACGDEHDSQSSLAEHITATLVGLEQPGASPAVANDVRQRLGKIHSIQQAIFISEQALEATKETDSSMEAQLVAALPSLPMPIDADAARTKLDELRLDVGALRSRINESQGEQAQWTKRIKDLEQELLFHKHRDGIQRLQMKLTEGLSGALNVLRQYQELLATTTGLKDLLDRTFNAALDRAVPPLERLLTEVFQRMTQQVSFNQVRVFRSPEQPKRRELRVASSSHPNQTFPPNVLNGQASKALQLVPYFVFSRFQPDIMELDLLLIDDPSESFDTSHVADLVSELALAAKHAQLFVATHERDKFEPHFAKFFANEPLTKVSVEGFTREEGPTFAVV